MTISDWILPAVYQHHFTTVIWVKPPWATQIQSGKHKIEIGKDKDGLLKTSSSLPYYVSDLCYCEQLTDATMFDLFVVELSHEKDNVLECCSVLSSILRDKNWCLDIDMDFYSTQNPFKTILGHHFDFMHDIFKYEERGSLEDSLNYREKQLGFLKCLTCEESSAEEDLSEFHDIQKILTEKYPNFKEDISHAKQQVSSDEFITDLYYIGQQTELPDHVSSESVITTLLGQTEILLKMLSRDHDDKQPKHLANIDNVTKKHCTVAATHETVAKISFPVTNISPPVAKISPPVAITLARSEYDEYSAPGTLDHVHCSLLCMLRKLYCISSSLKCPKSS